MAFEGGRFLEHIRLPGDRLLRDAATKGDLATVARLVRLGHTGAPGARPLWLAAANGHLPVVAWLAGNRTNNFGWTSVVYIARVTMRGSVVAFLNCVAEWSPFTILVACNNVADAKRALRSDAEIRLERQRLANLGQRAESDLWPGSPERSNEMAALVRGAIAPWSPATHSLYHLSFRTAVRDVMLVAGRIANDKKLPPEMWRLICSFFGRADWRVSQ